MVRPLCVQVDMLDTQDEVDAVLDFVSSNTSKLLQVCPLVIPGHQPYAACADSPQLTINQLVVYLQY
jgi:hypothetical protein